jgi:UDP-N-acetyl-D-mannosaminuronate dehydrogenase
MGFIPLDENFKRLRRVDMKISDVKIAVIGLGYVGLPLAVEFGKKYQTIGFDIKKNRIDELLKGEDLKSQ